MGARAVKKKMGRNWDFGMFRKAEAKPRYGYIVYSVDELWWAFQVAKYQEWRKSTYGEPAHERSAFDEWIEAYEPAASPKTWEVARGQGRIWWALYPKRCYREQDAVCREIAKMKRKNPGARLRVYRGMPFRHMTGIDDYRKRGR